MFLQHGVVDRLVFVHCVPQASLPAAQENHVAELCAGLSKRHDVGAVIVWGAPVPGANAWLRARGDPLVVIDATLAGLNAVVRLTFVLCSCCPSLSAGRHDAAEPAAIAQAVSQVGLSQEAVLSGRPGGT